MEEQPSPAEATGFRFTLTCERCGGESGSVEVLPPGQLPERAVAWLQKDRDAYLSREPGWTIFYRGLTCESGWFGAPLKGAEEAANLRRMFEPFDGPRVLREFRDIGWCPGCEVAYCGRCWRYTVREDERACPKRHGVWFD